MDKEHCNAGSVHGAANFIVLLCPYCGKPVDSAYQGYCEDCLKSGQMELAKDGLKSIEERALLAKAREKVG